MIRVVLTRVFLGKDRTLGRVEVYKDQLHMGSFACLELPWKENQKQVSCIPTGRYVIKAEDHSKFGHCFRVQNVRDRDGILIHAGNRPEDTHGCILPGMRFESTDVAASREALGLLVQMIPDTAQLDVI